MSATTLHTPTREEGQRLALRLADDLLTALPSASETLADYLRTAAPHPRRHLLPRHRRREQRLVTKKPGDVTSAGFRSLIYSA
jgi:hypothetical protein